MIAAEDLCRELGSDTFEHACREADRKAAGALERPPEKLSDAAVVAGDGAATEAVEAAR